MGYGPINPHILNRLVMLYWFLWFSFQTLVTNNLVFTDLALSMNSLFYFMCTLCDYLVAVRRFVFNSHYFSYFKFRCLTFSVSPFYGLCSLAVLICTGFTVTVNTIIFVYLKIIYLACFCSINSLNKPKFYYIYIYIVNKLRKNKKICKNQKIN